MIDNWKIVRTDKTGKELDEMLNWCICNINVSTYAWDKTSKWEYLPWVDGKHFYFMEEEVYTEFVLKFL